MPVDDPAAVAARCTEPVLVSTTDPAAPGISVNGVDVGGPIRSAEVTAAVSFVAAVPEVRARLVALQRATIGEGGIVVEGRDIGTTVAPDADVKVFLTARPEVRALRRAAEVQAAPVETVDAAAVASNEQAMAARDARDASRAASPMVRADDAHELDASDLTLAEVVAAIVTLVREAQARVSP